MRTVGTRTAAAGDDTLPCVNAGGSCRLSLSFLALARALFAAAVEEAVDLDQVDARETAERFPGLGQAGQDMAAVAS